MLKILTKVVTAVLSRVGTNVARPLVDRLGTMLAAYLIAKGADSDLVAQIANGAVAAVLVSIDLVRNYAAKQARS